MLSHFSHDLAIDLGTANTCVFARGRGIVVSEPSIVALNATSGAVEAIGLGARDMIGRSPDHIRPVRPIRGGVIADFDAAEKMLAYFMRKAHRSVRVAGDAMDDAIIQYVKRYHDLLIGERTAEEIKIAIGSAMPLEQPLTMEVKGRGLGRGMPRRITISDAEVREALAEPLKIIL